MNTLWLQSVGRGCCAMLLICAEYPELLELMEGTRLEFLWHPALSKTGGAEVRRTLADIREDRLALDISRVASSIVTGPNATVRCRVISF